MRVQLVGGRIELDDQPALVIAGEIHYFRVPRAGWSRRLELLAQAGAITVCTYIPWGVHESEDGDIDLDGSGRPELDLGAFLDLSAAHGLTVLARPGPFVMAELRHEGVPGRLVLDHPELRPRGWDGSATPTGALDYLAPAFLAEVARWYRAVAAVLTPRLAPAGGPVIGIQLDNEIGMLSWAANSPDLTDRFLAGFAAAHPDLAPPASPWNLQALAALADFRRTEFSAYLDRLRELADEVGWGTVPHLVNVHGTADGRAVPFGIGVSQLRQAVRHRPQLATGSDHYVGALDFAKACELHTAHAFLACVNGPDQPLTSLEFEAGTGDYGADLSAETDPQSVLLKTGLLLAQGGRLANFYLFAGGFNVLDPRPGQDGGDRIGITGERHGTAAPVTPEGEPGVAYPSTAAALQLMAELAPWAADWIPEHDDLALGFVADHYATDVIDPRSPEAMLLARELEWGRGGGPGAQLPRALLAAGFRFGAVDLQDPHARCPGLLVVGSPASWPEQVLRRLLEHAAGGGRVLLVGAVPSHDRVGRPSGIFAEALGLSVTGTVIAGRGVFPSVTGDALTIPELRSDRLQLLSCAAATVLLREVATGEPCALAIPHGAGTVAIVATDAALPVPAWAQLLALLGVAPGLTRDPAGTALITATSRTRAGERFLHVLNLSGYDQRASFALDGRPLATLDLPARTPRHLRSD